jgi:hypothetical protein
VQRGAAAVDDHGLARLQERRRRTGDGDLAAHALRLPFLVGRPHGRAGERSAVHPLQVASVGELIEVAADRVAGDAELALEIGRHHATLAAEDLEDAAVALLLKEAHRRP